MALFVGIMSGTSLDGADAVLARFDDTAGALPRLIAAAHEPFEPALRQALLALQQSGPDELQRAALAANDLAGLYGRLVGRLLDSAGLSPSAVTAIGAHGLTVRHRPELGFTWQINAPARLAEAAGIAVVADFRSRDVAAGGQGAPLVPAFHATVFRTAGRHRMVLNLGGMANLTDLPDDPRAAVRGWDCGPGNVLLDGWVQAHLGQPYDAGGAWAAGGAVIAALLERCLAEPWFDLPPPKSTGRDRFGPEWLERRLHEFASANPDDVQATLAELTAATVVDSIRRHAASPDDLILCGGGARNHDLAARITERLRQSAHDGRSTRVMRSDHPDAGRIAPEHVESLAFAWLARECLAGRPGNLPAVTGADGSRVLGAIYPR